MDHKTNVYTKTKGTKIMLTHYVTKEESPNNLPVSLKFQDHVLAYKDGTKVLHDLSLVSRMKRNNILFASKRPKCLATFPLNSSDKKGVEKRLF